MEADNMQNDNNLERERVTRAEVFEHLFPGNRFGELPAVDLHNARILAELYTDVEGRKRLGIIGSVGKGEDYTKRESFEHPDKLTMVYYTHGLVPDGEAEHPTMYRKHSFSDLIDVQEGEKLGGVASRPVSWYRCPVTQLALRMGDNPYFDKPEVVLGVLDAENKPCAIIHFGEGDKPRRPKRVEEKEGLRGLARSLVTS